MNTRITRDHNAVQCGKTEDGLLNKIATTECMITRLFVMSVCTCNSAPATAGAVTWQESVGGAALKGKIA